MNKSFALTLAASGLLLAGCCSTHHLTQWEYKVVPIAKRPFTPEGPDQWRKDQEVLMNALGKDGWAFVAQSETTLYFKRPVK